MKYIQKNGCPQYTHWCKSVFGTNEEDYRKLKGANKQVLFDTLIKEQGFICGYTMKRIDKDTAHIEHIKPESLCRKEKKGSDLDYKNLIACYPQKDRKDRRGKYRYGARKKDDWWDNGGKDFVSPLKPECESHFYFDMSGNITALSVAGATTIDVLALDHGSLTEERKRVIEEFIYGSKLSKAGAARAISNICNQNGEGYYNAFCIAIKDALQQYLNFLGNVRSKKQFPLGRN